MIIEPSAPDRGMVIELKTALTFQSLEKRADKAINQIKTKNYTEYLMMEGRENITIWGISFYKKRCSVKVEDSKKE